MRIKKLSIVIPYYNRRTLLFNVLRTIEYYQGAYPVEVVIIDDGSSKEHSIEDVADEFPTVEVRLETLKRDKKGWMCPTYSYNEGFAMATGDVILINSAECMHIGNVIEYVFNNMEDKSYITFSSYMGNKTLNDMLSIEPVSKIEQCIDPLRRGGWHLHSTLYNIIPYCAAITTKNMSALGGYDERFSTGIGFDDYDFTDRIYNLKLNPKIIDYPFVVHQWHTPTNYSSTINKDLLMRLRVEEPNRIKAKFNHTR